MMDTLFLRYTIDNGQLQVEPTLRDNLGAEARWGVRACNLQEAKRLSSEIHRMLLQGVRNVSAQTGPLPLEGAAGEVREIERLGRELRTALLHEDIVQLIDGRPSIDHLVFEYMPSLGGIAFEQMFLGDFVGFRFATGRQLISDEQKPPSQRPNHDGSYKGALIVDPNDLIRDAGVTELLEHVETVLDRWIDNHHTADKIRFAEDQVLACCPVAKADMEQMLRASDILSLIIHHKYFDNTPGHSGFVLKASANGSPAELFTAEELRAAIRRGDTPPSLVFAVACDSAIAKAWEEDWPHRHHRLYGMVDAMLQTGVRHYISALAEVPANGSPRIIELFHGKLAEGVTVGQAVQETRKALRTGLDGAAVPGGDILGLAFVLFGDPRSAYFCVEGHRVDTEPVRCCTAVENGDVCGQIVCPREDGFNNTDHRNHPAPRCNTHYGPPQHAHCAAGHAVDNSEQLKECKAVGCQNTVCSDCDGIGHQLCWEHFAHSGRPITGNARQTCSDRFSLHSNEKRTVHPLDDGWMWALCDDCWQHWHQNDTKPPACPHCGLLINETTGWSGVCDDCGKRLCEGCSPWCESTMYCPDDTRGEHEKNAGWLRSLDQRGTQDEGLATRARVSAIHNLSSEFQKNVATNIAERIRRFDRMPRLRDSALSVAMPISRVVWRVRQSAAILSAELFDSLRKPRKLPPMRHDASTAWSPPDDWLDAYRETICLEMHLLESALGSPVAVAVATLTPVEFKPGKGPSFVPCEERHIEILRECVENWWSANTHTADPDLYIAVFSPSRFAANVRPTLAAKMLSVLVTRHEHEDRWQVTPPPLGNLKKHIQRFVGLLYPESHHEEQQRLREWITKYLEDHDYVTLDKVQREFPIQTGHSVDRDAIQETFAQLTKTDKYEIFRTNGKQALRPAPKAW